MAGTSTDDVIRIRMDTASVVQAFLDLLATQAAEGETRAPARPRATAVYRELAPFRLAEYAHLEGGVGAVEGTYVGLPDGSLHAASDDIPEDAVDALVAGPVSGLPPVYVYVVLERAAPAAAIGRFFDALSRHLGQPLVGVFRDGGRMAARAYPGDGPGVAALEAQARLAEGEAEFHLGKSEVVGRFMARTRSADGRAFACIAYGYAKHVVAFTSAEDRDDFVRWSRLLAERMYIRGIGWQDLGIDEVFLPANPVAARRGVVTTAVAAPRQYQGGRAWLALGGADADGGRWLVDRELAGDYWRYVQAAVDANEHGADRVDGWVTRG